MPQTSQPCGTPSRDRRGVSPVIGLVLMVAITVLLAAILAMTVLGIGGEESAPHSRIAIATDPEDDQIRLRHQAGAGLSAERTRIIWEIDDTRVRSEPTTADQEFTAGETTLFTFDGSTGASGEWSSYGSPGSVDVDSSDQVRIEVYDTETNKPVFEQSVSAGAVARDLGSPGGPSTGGGGLIFAHDETPGAKTTHEINWKIQASDAAEGSSLNNVQIEYPPGVDFSAVSSRSQVVTAGIDEDGDGSVEDHATVECCPSDSDADGDVDGDGIYQGYSGNPNIFRIEFQGNADIDAGEEMIIQIEDVTNPSGGSYTVDIGIDGAQTETGTLEIN